MNVFDTRECNIEWTIRVFSKYKNCSFKVKVQFLVASILWNFLTFTTAQVISIWVGRQHNFTDNNFNKQLIGTKLEQTGEIFLSQNLYFNILTTVNIDTFSCILESAN